MILPDALLEDLDTMFLVRYKGHVVVNLVDCAVPNGMNLPKEVLNLIQTHTLIPN